MEIMKPHQDKKIVICSCIACVFAIFGVYIIPLIISIGIIIYQIFMLDQNENYYKNVVIKSLKETIHVLEEKVSELDTEAIRNQIVELKKEQDSLSNNISEKNTQYASLQSECANLEKTLRIEKQKALAEIEVEITKKKEQLQKEAKKITRFREIYKSIKHCIDFFFEFEPAEIMLRINPEDLKEIEQLAPSVMLQLQHMNSKELRKAYRENDKQITKLLEQYSSRYTTKTNRAIYSLMVISLRSELQNILTNLKYDKLDNAILAIKDITQKYLKIAGDGNQNIVPTLTKFIGELEYLFINAAKIEYNYYVKKEKERQEQLAIKEKMREEMAERKALEAEKKKIEKEETKYKSEIEKIKEQMKSAAQEELEMLNKRILELQAQLSDVIVKKEDIINLQNGKAGTVYVISNLGSFGDDVFKIGMTRRLDPQDRINELGSASVPFKFDVHSFIFSEDAVSLEKKMHEMLNSRRLNKVNMRKEFFKVSLADLESLVEEIEPTAEFNKTMLAQEYRASLDTDECYSEDYIDENFDEDDLVME